MQNVYWANGALTLKFEKRVNTSCTGITRNYAGGGFFLNTPAATSIAVEFEIMDNNVYGVSPYAGLFIAGGVNPSCGWGAEDDFFERLGGSQSQEVQTYHFWTPSCVHGVDQAFKTIPDIASTYHTYSVIRDGGTAFFVDGVAQLTNGGNNVANYVSSDDFMSYPMTVQMGVGGYNWALPNDSQLPAYVYVRHIKVWYKNP